MKRHAALALALLSACRNDAHAEPAQRRAFYATPYTRKPPVAELVALGRALFADPVLSASGKLSCASCHDAARAYGPPEPPPVPLDRSAPSLRYLQTVPRFDEHYHDPDGLDGADQGPAGGFMWDGRAQTAHDQARLPLFSPLEMANRNPAALVARLRKAPVGARLRAAFGDDVLDSTQLGMNAVLLALEVFQQSPPDFAPYDSKYDAYLRGQATLAPAEARGLALFNDAKKGNCASCHPSAMKDGAFPLFTDFGYVALGVPRNPKLPSSRDLGHHDLGLCGPLREDLAGHDEYCGRFRAPSLRNVALRRRFMHNGVFTSLEEVVRFYVERDLRPERIDDLPARYLGNLNRDPPFGARPALTPAEIADVVAFLGTLTDGYRR